MTIKVLVPLDPKHDEKVANSKARKIKHRGKQPGQFTQAERNEWIEMKMVEEYK